MIKKLLFASMLTIFSVVSTMAQYDLFIRDTNNLHFEWAKARLNKNPNWPGTSDTCANAMDTTSCDLNGWPMGGANDTVPANGWIWSGIPSFKGGQATDSVGAVTSGAPYEGNTHMEFNYNFSGWWCSAGFVLDPTYSNPLDFSGYTHLKLYWKGFSPTSTTNALTFTLSGKGSDNMDHNGASVVVCDSSNNLDYVEKIIPLSSFLDADLDVLTGIHHLGYAVSDGPTGAANTWWQFSGGGTGLWYMDAIQLVNIPDGILVEAKGYATMPDSTYDFGQYTVGCTYQAPTLFNISNAGATTLTLSGTPVITGTDAADFTVTTAPSTSISAGTSATFNITFNPSSVGTKTAILTIANDFSGSGSYVINLTGEGVNTGTCMTGVSSGNKGTDSYNAYPSPFTDETVIKVNSTVNAPVNIKVMDPKGTVVSTSEGHFTNEEITVGKGLEKGIYFVQATYQNRMQVIKIVKM
jgi:hypothetical protein